MKQIIYYNDLLHIYKIIELLKLSRYFKISGSG